MASAAERIEQKFAAIKARRQARGLWLSFSIPGDPEPFNCSPKDEATKARWIAQATARGWTLRAD